MKPWMIYGANGYTGELIAELARKEGMAPLLAGRNEAKLKAVSGKLGLPSVTVGLDDKEKLIAYLKGATLVLHCAGPFSQTALPMMEACIEARCHYLDITGEISVFEEAQKLSARAKEKNVMLLPGVGFDVVPTDCLASSLKKKLPDATDLELAFLSRGGVSRGTMKTGLEMLQKGGCSRRKGKLQKERIGEHRLELELGGKKRTFTSVPWGDVSTAFHSTGIPNITAYTYQPKKAVRIFDLLQGPLKPLVNKTTVKLAQKVVDKMVVGPSEEIRNTATVLVWGRVKNKSGKTEVMSLEVPEGYRFTADAALACVKRVLNEKAVGGFQTPSTAFGNEFVFELPDVRLL